MDKNLCYIWIEGEIDGVLLNKNTLITWPEPLCFYITLLVRYAERDSSLRYLSRHYN